MNAPNNKIYQYVILDTCILQYFGNKDLANNIIEYFKELNGRGFILAISDFSVFESLTNSTTSQEAEIIKTLNIFPRFTVDDNVLVAAGQLSALYSKEDSISYKDKISDGDKIISANTVLSGSLLMTANLSDFPDPFFITVERRRLFYLKRGAEKMLVIDLLSPDYAVVNKRFSERR